ncbi:helix-turn-helix transcriptional regulator [Adlercreutzia sp. R21]|uniref:Helix-turn-helix transcriptional regulator n=1 Tax=Adlercreutzia wanghongyangiae TaxID=3111451 RepID=A0ABU6IKH4_9ACTN|nr:helix-turn-helix transcriptional regulator [Adlercreutzia sp. R21]MEC4176951.1 helix-turn-helix transcriptional regulator [Adlercreutzia sp. R7]MEC4185214.1 helix-turn-helix transcriptional regulator [Adlercreutzia sp. R21]
MEKASAIGHASSWGYACFLTVNATSVWGGIFPFLPLEFQTAEVTLTFFLAQAVAFGGAFLASTIGSYYFPHGARRMLVSLSAVLLFVGSACLIAAMYVASAALLLVGAGGIFLGVGCAGMFMLWQRYFASLPPRAGNYRLIVGTALAPFIYFALYLVPIALTAFLIPLIFVPLCGLCVALSVREMNFEQPMFQDVPRQHPRVYRQVLSDYWRSALCVGSLAFASGVIRGVALLHEEISALVNGASMLGLLLSAAALLVLWHRTSFRFGLTSVFRVVYPVLITGFLLLPFCGPVYVNLFTALAYMVFSLVQMLMMMQCAQVSRDRGINPVFIYGFFGAVAYILQSLGFLFGWASDLTAPAGSQWLFFVALIASYGLGLTLLVATGTLFKPVVAKGTVAADPIEFFSLAASPAATPSSAGEAGEGGVSEIVAAEGGRRLEDDGDAVPAKPVRRRRRPSASEDAGAIRDRLSKQCLILQERHGLSMREAEVMELIARGNSMAAIAERLVISENTVRTHAKHIYTKLDIHKRQELLDMLNELNG